MDRQLWVVDIETTGLDTSLHVPLEVAAVNVVTRESYAFVPWLPDGALGAADPVALGISRYYERGVFKQQLSFEQTGEAYEFLWGLLAANTLGGSNPRFDAAMLLRGVSVLPFPAVVFPVDREPWHHRLADLSAYAAGVLGMPPEILPGLAQVCELLGVVNDGEHTALGDAKAAAECFRRLRTRLHDCALGGAS